MSQLFIRVLHINYSQLDVQRGSLRENNFGGVHGDSVSISFRREIEIQRCERKLVIYSPGSVGTALKLLAEIARYIYRRSFNVYHAGTYRSRFPS